MKEPDSLTLTDTFSTFTNFISETTMRMQSMDPTKNHWRSELELFLFHSIDLCKVNS